MSIISALFLRDAPPAYRTPLRFLKLFLFSDSYRLALNYRIRSYLSKKNGAARRLLPLLKRAQFRKWGCDISYRAKIGDRIRFAHPTGIVIGEGVIIGDDVQVFQGVTLGSHGRGGRKLYPTIGDGATLFAGAVVVGGVQVGSKARIGANAVVTIDVPPNATAVGVPARIIGG